MASAFTRTNPAPEPMPFNGFQRESRDLVAAAGAQDRLSA
jgi:hypothetical protein